MPGQVEPAGPFQDVKMNREGLFSEQVAGVRRVMNRARLAGTSREYRAGDRPSWPRGAGPVLREDTVLELGAPGMASASLLLWTHPEGVNDGLVTLLGPDISEAEGSLPFARVLIAGGSFPDMYQSYRELRDVLYDTRLEGLSVRAMPSRQTVWCRVSAQARQDGISLVDMGSSLVSGLRALAPVESAEVLLVTSGREEVEELAKAASGARKLVDAMMKMYQEENFDCEDCEYQDVCDGVMELKMIRDRLSREKGS